MCQWAITEHDIIVIKFEQFKWVHIFERPLVYAPAGGIDDESKGYGCLRVAVARVVYAVWCTMYVFAADKM